MALPIIPAQRTHTTPKPNRILWDCGMYAHVEGLGRVRIRTIGTRVNGGTYSWDHIDVARVNAEGENLSDSYRTYAVHRDELKPDELPEPPAADQPPVDTRQNYVRIAGSILYLLREMNDAKFGPAPWPLFNAIKSSDPYRDDYTTTVTIWHLDWLDNALKALTDEYMGTDLMNAISATHIDVAAAQAEMLDK